LRVPRLLIVVGPAVILVVMGVLVPQLALFFGGAGVGWMVAAQIVLRNRQQMEYRIAVRHLRHSEYAEAVAAMDRLILAEPQKSEHYRFRAELYRLWGKLGNARADYEHVIELEPHSEKGYTGLAETYAQQGDFEQARDYAVQALERAPRRWMTAYNLGLIEDRLGNAEAAVEHLEKALAVGRLHSRYRLLTQLWLARNTYRQGRTDKARQHLALMRQQADGVRDWRMVFESDQAAPLRELLQPDVDLAEHLLDTHAPLDLLDRAPDR
jgi:tetratricopeptide (TPR) repeat protein